ncbi:hypothetical protein D3C78_1209250 [compost metagenome]
MPSMACSKALIMPIDFKPVTNTDAATSRATIGIALPIPLKKCSVPFSTSFVFLWRTNSQTIAIAKDNKATISTLTSIFISDTDWRINTAIRNRIGSTGSKAYTNVNNLPPSTSLISFNSASRSPASVPIFLSIRFCQK